MQDVQIPSVALATQVDAMSERVPMFFFFFLQFFEYSVIDGFLQDGSIEDPLYDQLEQAMAEAENSRFEASEEAVRCAKEERDVVEAIRKVYFRSQTTFSPHPLKGR